VRIAAHPPGGAHKRFAVSSSAWTGAPRRNADL